MGKKKQEENKEKDVEELSTIGGVERAPGYISEATITAKDKTALYLISHH